MTRIPFRTAAVLVVLSLALPSTVSAVHLDGRLAYLTATADKTQSSFTGSVRFASTPSEDDFVRLEAVGVVFHDFGQGRVGSRTVYPARIPFAALATLGEDPALAAVDCAWRPHGLPPLPVSRPQVEADLAWTVPAPGGGTLVGDGVLVCDIDTGINYHHANFFDLSGEVFAWLDVDASGDLSAGDAVDLDGDGVPDPGEDLLYHEAAWTDQYGNDPARYDTDFDFLFNDADGSGTREYGPPAFGENDPCYGERIFLTDDTDADGVLDPGEHLLALGASRIRAIMNKDGSVKRRGVDLLQSEGDDWGHGTQVGGIMGGGWPGRHQMTGMAPGVEMIYVDYGFADEPPFLIPVEAGLAWAVAEGADVVLFEDGEWVWEFLDGSSNLEIMINEYAAVEGVIMVTPTGNLASGHMHARFPSAGNQILTVDPAPAVVWPSFLWTAPVSLGLRVTPPLGSQVILPLDGTTMITQGYRIYSNFSVSPRGTRRIDLRLAGDGIGATPDGAWVFVFDGPDTEIHGYFGDDTFAWSADSRWMFGEEAAYTATWPATADSGICVAAYAPAGDGEIHAYSGTGPRIDGYPAVDVAAPGSYVFSASPTADMDFRWFSGTSSAGPHVAGAAALLKELFPDLDHGECRRLLRAGAAQDEHTTDPDRAGAGKLRIYAAMAAELSAVAATPRHPALAPHAVPNPFNAGTLIRLDAPAAGPARVRVFDVAGREVWSATLDGAAGRREIQWNGCDAAGRALASGLYFAHVRQGDAYAVGKLILVK